MASFLRKLRPAVPSVPEHENENSLNFEYSFAMEYNGPPFDHSIPEAAPIKIDQIPLASTAPPPVADQFFVPLIQPFIKSKHSNHNPNTKLKLTRDKVDNSGPLGCAQDGDDYTGNLSHRLSISSSYESSYALEKPDDDREDRISQIDIKLTNSDSTESSGASSLFVSSEIFSSREEDVCSDKTPRHVKRPSIVNFRDLETNDMEASEEFKNSLAGSNPIRATLERKNINKGICNRCNKRNRFTEKVVCLVCDARYCRNCVLKAMGSMPEGRKCVTCIGYGIDETMRGILGKCPRMLKGLLSEFEVKQVMHFEMFCGANQIPGDLVIVNEEPLDQHQLLSLISCPNPPKKLRPGSYWYDKASGFWGKEGQPPCQLISPQLEVGGSLKGKASNGNTSVTINGREITKKELWVLKLLGVPCEGWPCYWLNADGSYQEEGQYNAKGLIWDKTWKKMLFAMRSLPVPSKSSSVDSGKTLNGDNREKKILHKLLLCGSIKSGSSTIFKQAKLLYDVPFSEDERQIIKSLIQSNLYTYLGILLEGREQFEEESLMENRKRELVDESTSSANAGKNTDTTIYSIGPRLKAFSDWLLEYMVSGNLGTIFPTATLEYAQLVEELWKDAAIQATYDRRNELEKLPRAADYFLHRAVEISKVDYEPTDMDITYAEGITLSKSLTSMEFSFPNSSREISVEADYQHDPSVRYQLIKVHQKSLGANCRHLEMFEDIDIVLFCVALSDYDEYTVDCDGISTNKMLAAKHLFENIITHPTLSNKRFLLILNKFDLFEEKIGLVPLTRCEWFCDFNPFISPNSNGCSSSNNNTPLSQSAFHYIARKFKRIFHSLTGRTLFVSLVTALEADYVDEALRYAREVMMWEKWDPSFITDCELTSSMGELSTL